MNLFSWPCRPVRPLGRKGRKQGSVRTRPAPASRRRLTGAKHVRRGEMVPATTLADLDHIHPEFSVFGSHIRQFRGPFDPARVLSEFVSVHIGDICDVRLTADRAAHIGGLAGVLGRAEQGRMSVASVGHRGGPRVHRRERGAPGERVIHNGATSGRACHAPSIARRTRLAYPQWRFRRAYRTAAGERGVALRRTVAYAETRWSIYRTEISGRDIVRIHQPYPPGEMSWAGTGLPSLSSPSLGCCTGLPCMATSSVSSSTWCSARFVRFPTAPCTPA